MKFQRCSHPLFADTKIYSYELCSFLNLSRFIHCSVIKVRFVVFSNFDILSQVQVVVNNFFNLFFTSSDVVLSFSRQPVYNTKPFSLCQQLFSKKLNNSYFQIRAEKEGFEPSRRSTRPIPLAGAPLRPLEYFSKVII